MSEMSRTVKIGILPAVFCQSTSWSQFSIQLLEFEKLQVKFVKP